MYMVLTEEQGKKIRSLGISVIEYKRCISDVISVYRYITDKYIEAICRAAEIVGKAIGKFVDDVSMIFQGIKDSYGYKVTFRYKFVKLYSKLGYDKRKMWVATRHTWLARSNC